MKYNQIKHIKEELKLLKDSVKSGEITNKNILCDLSFIRNLVEGLK